MRRSLVADTKYCTIVLGNGGRIFLKGDSALKLPQKETGLRKAERSLTFLLCTDVWECI